MDESKILQQAILALRERIEDHTFSTTLEFDKVRGCAVYQLVSTAYPKGHKAKVIPHSPKLPFAEYRAFIDGLNAVPAPYGVDTPYVKDEAFDAEARVQTQIRALRARTGDNTLSSRAAAGKFQLVSVTGVGGSAAVTVLSVPMQLNDFIAFLKAQ